ncbi:hypothetical protein L1987_46514 [Smallanthus sonchifolius]|uniref:Uncharacterized protein n=1 Tax=Smallanthus sonchifolius TaxID=185202 RepID=A0ACB9G0Y5_9ASTR|nr:hypothetical protein L1987_46514 [Smallanthus sonchifolius]
MPQQIPYADTSESDKVTSNADEGSSPLNFHEPQVPVRIGPATTPTPSPRSSYSPMSPIQNVPSQANGSLFLLMLQPMLVLYLLLLLMPMRKRLYNILLLIIFIIGFSCHVGSSFHHDSSSLHDVIKKGEKSSNAAQEVKNVQNEDVNKINEVVQEADVQQLQIVPYKDQDQKEDSFHSSQTQIKMKIFKEKNMKNTKVILLKKELKIFWENSKMWWKDIKRHVLIGLVTKERNLKSKTKQSEPTSPEVSHHSLEVNVDQLTVDEVTSILTPEEEQRVLDDVKYLNAHGMRLSDIYKLSSRKAAQEVQRIESSKADEENEKYELKKFLTENGFKNKGMERMKLETLRKHVKELKPKLKNDSSVPQESHARILTKDNFEKMELGKMDLQVIKEFSLKELREKAEILKIAINQDNELINQSKKRKSVRSSSNSDESMKSDD